MIGYWIFQLAGAVLGSLCVLIAFNQNAVAPTATLPGPSGAGTALFLELLATAIFVLVILHSSSARAARGHGARRDPADARGRAPRADPVQRLVAQHRAELRAGADRLRVDGLLGLHRRPARRRDHRVARVRRSSSWAESRPRLRRHRRHRLRRPTSRRPARGSLRSARPGGARRGSRPRRAPPGSGTGARLRLPARARSHRRRADRRARPTPR